MKTTPTTQPKVSQRPVEEPETPSLAVAPHGDPDALLERFGLERAPASEPKKPAGPIQRLLDKLRPKVETLLSKIGLGGDFAAIRRRVSGNIRNLVQGLKDREAKLVKKSIAVLSGLGLAARKLATFNDLRQLKDFATLALHEGRPMEIFAPLVDVTTFIVKYPEEARNILRFLEKANADTWTQKTPWIEAATGPSAVPPPPDQRPLKKADVVVIGAGLSGGSVAHHFAEAFKEDRTAAREVLIIDRDKKSTREHAASLRNAGIVCTAMEYIFGIDEAIGEKPIERIQKSLNISRAEAEEAYHSMMNVMRDATGRLRKMMGEKSAETGPSLDGGLDVAITQQDVDDFRAAAAEARRMGFKWDVVDAAYLGEHFGMSSDHIKGAIYHRDGGQVHSGKLIKALFDQALAASKKVDVQWDTELTKARPDPQGEGWILETSQGPIHAKEVIDAREGFAPFRWREARFSQIHIVDVPKDSAPMKLGETNVCHGLSYMRKIDDGKYLVGSGDFPIHDTAETPAPLASVALYSAAMFKKLFPDVPFNIERVWGGIFGLSTDGIPVTGELADGWHVIGGAGGQGLSLMPALAADTVNEILGKTDRLQFNPSEDFGPRRFFVGELRHDLSRALHGLEAYATLPVEKVRVEIGDGSARPVERDGTLVFSVDSKTLDAMNPDVGVLLGESGGQAIRARETVKAEWIRAQLAEAKRGIAAVTGAMPQASQDGGPKQSAA